MKTNKCQSCGMPRKMDPDCGGTESDGSKSEKYCSFCYQNGKFTDGGITDVKEYQKYVIGIMKEKGMNSMLAWLLTRGIPYLERWKNTK